MTWVLERGRGPALALALSVLGGCSTSNRQRQELAATKSAMEGSPMPPRAPTAPASLTAACPAGLLAARRGGSASDRYVVPEAAESRAFSALVSELLAKQADRGRAAEHARALGYRLEDVPEIPDALLLRELPTRKRGGGAYLIRLGSASRLIVQAPHTFFDEGTLPLACELFRRSQAAALFVDTAHRYKAAEVDERGDYPADIAHAKDSLFQAATLGALGAITPLAVVQIHGFGPRESGAAVVLSTGVAQRNVPFSTRARDELLTVVAGPVLRFPDECQELGATTNAQGTIVRAAGGEFLHVEMSAPLRQALLTDQALRARYFDALTRSIQLP